VSDFVYRGRLVQDGPASQKEHGDKQTCRSCLMSISRHMGWINSNRSSARRLHAAADLPGWRCVKNHI
jgi:hypothetical protein